MLNNILGDTIEKEKTTPVSYKEPVFLFTSSSMRQAAWAGWYSALGDKKQAEEYCHTAYAWWAKEISAGRRYTFADRFNNDIYNKIDFDALKKLTDEYLKNIGKEIRKAKEASKKEKGE